MVTIASLMVLVDGNTTPLTAALGKGSASVKSFEATTAGTTSAAGSSWSKFGLMAAAGVAVAGVALIKFGADSVKAFAESEDVIAQTEAVIKSTGGAAGYTASQIGAMATELEHLTTFSDEEVASAENLLLTFMNIGHEVLPQATKAVLNMSTALGQDLKSSSIQLGKALNDPIIGLTALRRVGVMFTESQVRQIKALAESNDLLGAQKIILGELTNEFGGSAAKAAGTLTGKTQQLANAWDDFKESIGSFIAQVGPPVLDLLMKLVGALEAVGLATRDSATAAIEQFNLEPIVATIQEGTPKLAAWADTIALLNQEMEDSGFPRSMFIADLGDLNDALQKAGMSGELTAMDIHLLATGDYNAATATGTLSTSVQQLGDDMDSAGKKVKHFAGMSIPELKQFRTDTVTAMSAVAGGLDDASNSWRMTAAAAVKATEIMLREQQRIAADLRKLDEIKIGDKLKAQLLELGPGMVDAFVHGNAGQQAKIRESLKAYDKASNDTATAVKKLLSTGMNKATSAAADVLHQGGTEGGKQFDAGVASGMYGGIPGVTAAARSVAAAAVQAAKDQLGEASPSKVMKIVGADLTIGFAEGIESKMSTVISAIQAVVGDGLSKARLLQAKELEAMASDMASKMTRMVDAVQKDWDRLHSMIDDFKSSVRSGFDTLDILGGAQGLGQKLHDDLVASVQAELDAAKLAQAPAEIIAALEAKLKATTDSTVVPSAADFATFLKDQLATAQQFASALTQLQSLGLNQGLLSELASQGPASLPFLQALISGGADVISQFNDTQSAIDAIAGKTAGTLADDIFGKRLSALGDEVSNLQDRLAAMAESLASRVANFIDAIRADAVGTKIDDVIHALEQLAKRLDAFHVPGPGNATGSTSTQSAPYVPGMDAASAAGATASGNDIDYPRLGEEVAGAIARQGGFKPVMVRDEFDAASSRYIARTGAGRRGL